MPTSRDPGNELRGGLLRTSFPARTLVGFIAATVAVLIIALLSFQSLRSRAEAVRRMTGTLEVTQALETLLSRIKDAETGQRGYILTGTARYLDPYQGAVASLPHDLEVTRVLLSDDPAQLQRLGALEGFLAAKLAELKETVELRRSGRVDDALEVVRTDRGKELMDRIRDEIAEMKVTARAQLEARTRDWEQKTSLTAIVTWGGAALLLILIGVAAIMSSRDFREQRLQAWLRTGQNELGTRMQGAQELNELGDNIAGFLAGYVDAQVGAVYFAETPEELRRIGAYALPAAAVGGEGGAVAGGLARQVLAENDAIVLDDVPADYFSVSSGLGKSQPRHLVVAPTSIDRSANGTIELGSFQILAQPVLDLLRRVSEPIGIALQTAKYRQDLKKLLEETQRQAEELQTQQEELRVQNEELEQQTRALQESQGRLENQQSELEQINSQLEEQTQALEKQRDDLTRAQGELQRSSMYKSEFLANMSHELRTPLNSSLILAKLLADNRDGNLNAEQVKFAQTIYSAGNDLLTLINDILDVSKIEAGKLDVKPEHVGLLRIVDELVDTFQPIARDKHLELTTAIESGLPATIYTDPNRLQQIVRNLISNALKFTEQGGVALSIGRAPGGRVAFAVRDTGIGIPAEQHEVIFDAFRQADGTTNRKYGGTGLGLSISRDLAFLLGGELRVQSAPGRGSTFTLILPHELPAQAPVRAAPSPPARRAPVVDDREGIGPDSRPILVIEDDVHFAKIIYELAHELSFKAILAHTAEEGLAMAEQIRPRAIVLDIGLPDRSGLSVLDALKHSATTRHIPVHVVSGSDYAQAALAMGAAGYAIKPIEREKLGEALKRLEARFRQKLRRVLVVEDDELLRDSTCRLLAAGDVEVVAVGTAAEALAALETSTFDCMVLDLSLPDRTGFDLLEEMSRKEEYSFPPVVVYTGRSLSREEELTLRRFSSSIILKGARSPERLLDEVTLFLHQVEAELPPDRQRMLRSARHREGVFEGRRVLVVEDDVRNIFALSSVLEPKGAKVEIARNGREALEHLKHRPGVDLVLMDIMMPEMDGLEATRAIRRQPDLAKLPIIALTAKATAEDREQCLAAGASDYIAKPLDVDKLLSLARVWMPK